MNVAGKSMMQSHKLYDYCSSKYITTTNCFQDEAVLEQLLLPLKRRKFILSESSIIDPSSATPPA